MAQDPVDSPHFPSLPDRVAAAERVGQRRIGAAAELFHLSHDARIDDRTAAALDTMLRATVATVEEAVRAQAARLLTARGDAVAAQGVASGSDRFDAVQRAGLFRDPALFAELHARVRLAGLSAAVPVTPAEGAERPLMVARLAQSTDRLIAAAAVAMLSAETRRAAPVQTHCDLPRALHERIAWWIAAALRAAARGGAAAVLDTVLAEAVRRATDRQGDPVAAEVAAMRLAHAIDAAPEALPALLEEAVGEGRLILFVALAARGAGLEYERMRALVIDRDDVRLWVVLRALGVDRPVLARIGFALAEADPARDMGAFAAALDAIMAVSPDAARSALTPMALDPHYHAALSALDAGG